MSLNMEIYYSNPVNSKAILGIRAVLQKVHLARQLFSGFPRKVCLPASGGCHRPHIIT